MAEEVDELFGSGAGAPKPRSSLVFTLVFGGIAISILGLACTSLPGVLMVLAAWAVAETERDRLESGYLPRDSAARVKSLRVAAWAGVIWGLAILVIQGYFLFRTPLYEGLWGAFLDVVFIPFLNRLAGTPG
jgi:hypothetical protein